MVISRFSLEGLHGLCALGVQYPNRRVGSRPADVRALFLFSVLLLVLLTAIHFP